MHLTHPLQTMSFFHLPASSASAFDVGYPGVWGIQSWGIKRSGSVLLLLGRGFSLIPFASPALFLSSYLLPALYLFLLSVLPSTCFKHPFSPSFLHNQDEGRFSYSSTHCSLNHSHPSGTTIISHVNPAALSAHFIKEPFRTVFQPPVKCSAGVYFTLFMSC